MRSFKVFTILVLVSFLAARPVKAQSTVGYDAMQIDIWPEYDRPDVLVIYRMTLSSQLTLPTQVSVEIPQGMELNSLAWQDVDGSLYVLSYTTEVVGDWQKITFSAPSAKIQVEYYDTRMTRAQGLRSFDFSWISPAAITDLVVSVQQPVNATNMQITPDFGAGQSQSDGLVYYTYDVGKVSSGTPLDVSLTYQKNDDSLSANQQPVQASSPISGKTDFGRYLPWALIGLAALLIVGGLGWYFGYRDTSRPKQRSRGRRSSVLVKREAVINHDAQEVVHCHRCGRKANPGDVYCRTCGTRLRS